MNEHNDLKSIRKTNNIIGFIMLSLIVCTLIFVVTYVTTYVPTTKELKNTKDLQQKQDSLEQIISYYKKTDNLYNKKLVELNDSIAYLNALLEYNEQEINALKKRRNAKNINISKYSTADIKKFWSDRYKDSLQSK